MERRKFLRYLGIGAAAVPLVPLLVGSDAPIEVKPISEVPKFGKDYPIGDGIIAQMEKSLNHTMPREFIFHTNLKGHKAWEDAVTAEMRHTHAEKLEREMFRHFKG